MYKYCICLLLICSIVVLSQDCATLYSKCDYQGESVKVCDDSPSLKSFQTKSAKIPNGMVITVYDDSYFQGRSLELSQDTACIEDSKYSDNKIKQLESDLANVKSKLSESENKQKQSETELNDVKSELSNVKNKFANLENDIAKLNLKSQLVGIFSTKGQQVTRGGIFGDTTGILLNQLILSKSDYVQQSDDFRFIKILKTGFYKITFIFLSKENNPNFPCLMKNGINLMCSYSAGPHYDQSNAETYEQLVSGDKIYVRTQLTDIYVNPDGLLYHRVHFVYLGEKF